jgi:hypothetical protein
MNMRSSKPSSRQLALLLFVLGCKDPNDTARAADSRVCKAEVLAVISDYALVATDTVSQRDDPCSSIKRFGASTHSTVFRVDFEKEGSLADARTLADRVAKRWGGSVSQDGDPETFNVYTYGTPAYSFSATSSGGTLIHGAIGASTGCYP